MSNNVIVTTKQAILLLDSLDDGDKEKSHGVADEVLCNVLRSLGHSDVAEAYERAVERVGFYYA